MRNWWRGLLRPAVQAVLSFAAVIPADPCVGGTDLEWSLGLSVSENRRPLVALPAGGLALDLWSDPAPGALVLPGDCVRLRFRATDDCYVTVMSVDTDGRARLLFPSPHSDGWVQGGRDYCLPEGRRTLVFSGPTGIEYVYAVASADPMVARYPDWLLVGCAPRPDPWCDDADFYRLGWMVGDPYYQFDGFCRRLVLRPDCLESYTSAWISFAVSARVGYPRSVCRDCHGFAAPDPYGPPCSATRIVIGAGGCSGRFDFHVRFEPRYWYEICAPRHNRYHRQPEFRDRWRWSSCDGTHRLREVFQPGPKPHRTGRSEDRTDRDRDDRKEWVDRRRSADRDDRPRDDATWARDRGHHEGRERAEVRQDRQSGKKERRAEGKRAGPHQDRRRAR